jgi:hypothetical protein
VGRQSLFQEYHRPAEAYDEAFAAPGLPCPHRERVVQMLDSLGVEELTRRWEQARRLIRENGVTYNAMAIPRVCIGRGNCMPCPWGSPPKSGNALRRRWRSASRS